MYNRQMMQMWRDLSVSKKLYGVVGVMASLIALELATLSFAMNTLSTVRSIVGAESIWSKAQKDAVLSLYRYIFTSDQKYYEEFHQYLQIPEGDRIARMEIGRPNFQYEIVEAGFLQGQVHKEDIPDVIRFIKRFRHTSYIQDVVQVWKSADILLEELIVLAQQIQDRNHKNSFDMNSDESRLIVDKIDLVNAKLTILETKFSQILGQASRNLEGILIFILVLVVLTIESTGIYLVFSFSKSLSSSLAEMSAVANEVGGGNFSHLLPVRSKDEVGQLAVSINKMVKNLEENIGQRKQAESANQTKTLFLANMSHEIRTPLGVILGLADIMKDPNLSKKDYVHYIDVIQRTGKNLQRVINDILDISKVEAGHLEIELTKFPTTEFFMEIKSMFRMRAAENNNSFSFHISNNMPQEIITDRIRLKQILVNLVNNSFKFTKNGAVRIEASYIAEGSVLHFEIDDTGVGIQPECWDQIFHPFLSIENPLERHYEGTGLGLVISKRLAQDLGGDVLLKQSEPGKGSTFTVCVKLANKEDNATAMESGQQAQVMDNKKIGNNQAVNENVLAGKRILVIEDSVDNQLLLNIYLSRKAVQVQFANNGEEGVDLALKENFDLILMDMQMPLMDGYQATRHLREVGYKKTIIALTAHAMTEDRERCLEAGCSDYLSKPITESELYAIICKHIV